VNSLFKFWLEGDLPSKLHKNFQGNEIVLQSAQQFRRYFSRIVLLSFSYRSPIILLSFSYRSPIVLLSFSYRSPIVLLSFSYRSPIGKRKTIRKQYGNNTETIRNGTKDERMRIGGTRVGHLTIIYLNSYYNGMTQWTFTCHSSITPFTHKKRHTSQNRFVWRIIFIRSKTTD